MASDSVLFENRQIQPVEQLLETAFTLNIYIFFVDASFISTGGLLTVPQTGMTGVSFFCAFLILHNAFI